MIKPLKKAVLPVAGLGTRFLPATKCVPKEMLTVVDRPLIQYAIDEAREAGIEEFCLVSSRGKDSLIDYFDISYELEDTLKARKKASALKALEATRVTPGSMLSVRQQEPLGLGHAIWCAREFIGNDPFAILLPDDVVQSKKSCIGQLVEVYNKTGGNVLAVTEVPREQTGSYGILDVGKDDGKTVEVKGLVEKPDPKDAPSTLSVIGRYVLTADVLKHLAKLEKGAGGEVQLTDAMAKTIGHVPFHGYRYEGKRFDCGSKIGFLEAQIAFALEREELAPGVREFLTKYK
ncbi:MULTISPECIES: UTP--glucose-1-phosphate uridylyltransferase GalU [Komagataeibacter]|uniref:UTP--glucose-1-phosphate uridylyltransferase n=4 Tax=Komagataeibacter TaxID=1434011 RepID=A0A318QZA5_9PROT|nr:UTP--glucose-1-phosphate uridylyltransferase [Komagataeibacter intermedius AF2]PYD82762.1 UTP--glucose-1-phosphate uridylyltransferase [Komagataeibacter oboediens]GBQ78661.1 UTP-glucose-1-phosphate uridylyltransferase [Komagataeibacter intermedius NRIC 0521]GBR28148.1 UTP-glucose-1-phosphate uridylyltransferase [Komagataeibacter oboediens DSM 11826]GCE82742.1 UTP-glucose-1-phosphate uridylyltransferase [Komagataeibacter diospyri]